MPIIFLLAYFMDNSNTTCFIGYVNNAVIKLMIYFTSHMLIARQIMNIIPEWFHVSIYRTIVYTNIVPGWLNELDTNVVGLPNNSYKSITNTAWVCTLLCKLQKGCTWLEATSDKAYQLLTHGQWFSPGFPASSTTKTGHHDIAEILLKVALNTINQIKSNLNILTLTFLFFRKKNTKDKHLST
jgi:hypothetical protein